MFAIERLGFKAVLSNNPDEIKAADKVIFPEWEASSAMKMLLESGLDSLIPTLKQPVLGICLGQLMCTWKKGIKRLGYFDIDVIKFTTKVNGLESNL
jgi:glutamine amidotransferase